MSGPVLVVEPVDSMIDETLRIAVTGLSPGQRLRLAVRIDEFRAGAWADFVADDDGVVDVSTAAPVAGTYEGCDAMALLWSAELDDDADFGDVFATLASLVPIHHVVTASVDGAEFARVEVTRRMLAPGTSRLEVREGRIRGTYFAPDGAPGHGPVIVVGGSDGANNSEMYAALLAANGFPALALAWFAYEDLPAEPRDIPLEYFEEAIAWLRSRPEVGGARVGVMGSSLGGELALLLGATFAEVAAVVGIVPSGLLWDTKWTHRGVPLRGLDGATCDPETMAAIGEAFTNGTPVSGTPGFLRQIEAAGTSATEAEIAVECTRGPILLLSGEDDALWPATELAGVAVARLERCGFAHAYEHRSYPGAGHLAFLPPSVPTTRDWVFHPQMRLPVAVGGNPRATAAAARDAWPRLLEFLSDHVTAAHVS